MRSEKSASSKDGDDKKDITAFQDNKNTLTEEFELNRCLRKNILRQRNKIFTKHASTACQIHLVTCYNSNITTLVTKYFIVNNTMHECYFDRVVIFWKKYNEALAELYFFQNITTRSK